MKTIFYLLIHVLLLLGHNGVFSANQVDELSGTYQVCHLVVFDQVLDCSRIKGAIKLFRTDAKHVKLEMDIHYLNEMPMPVETMCSIEEKAGKCYLLDVKSGEVVGYLLANKLYLSSEDANGSKTKIVAKLLKT